MVFSQNYTKSGYAKKHSHYTLIIIINIFRECQTAPVACIGAVKKQSLIHRECPQYKLYIFFQGDFSFVTAANQQGSKVSGKSHRIVDIRHNGKIRMPRTNAYFTFS